MKITIEATKEELAIPFPNFASKFVDELQKQYDAIKEQSVTIKKGDVRVTVTVEEVK